MKRFAKKIGLFLAIPLVLTVLMEVAVESIPNSYTYKRDYMERHGKEIKTLILGSSQAYDDIDPSVLDNAFNLANSSQCLEDDSRLLAKYIDGMPNLERVIIPFGYETMSMTSEAYRRTYYTIYMGLYPRFPINKYSFEVFNPELSAKKVVKYLSSKDVTLCDSLGQRMGHTVAARDAHVEPWNRDLAGMVANDKVELDWSMRRVNDNYNYLCDIMNLCLAREIEVVLVKDPVQKGLKEQMTESQRRVLDETFEAMEAYAICIDATEWEIADEMWYNATHLVKEYSPVFTQQLCDSIAARRGTR